MNHRLPTWLGVALAVFSVLSTCVIIHAQSRENASPPKFSIIDVGVLPGGTDAYAFGLNNHGDVSGRSAVVTGNGRNRTITTFTFLYKSGKLLSLGAPTKDQASLGFAVNDSDQVAATGIDKGFESPYTVSLRANGKRDWLALPNHGKAPGYSLAYGVNDRGSLVGTVDGQGAALWTKTKSGYQIKVLPGKKSAVAMAVDERNDAVGYDPTGHSTLWLAGGSELSLTSLDGTDSEALSVAAGTKKLLVGGASKLPSGVTVATLWTVEPKGKRWTVRSVIGLGVPTGYKSSEVESVNAAGEAVGYAWRQNALTAVVWTGGQAYTLDPLLSKRGGWALTRAQAVNDKGQIAGWGTVKGEIRPFLLTPKG